MAATSHVAQQLEYKALAERFDCKKTFEIQDVFRRAAVVLPPMVFGPKDSTELAADEN